ncbi:MAG: type II secretion system F family protein [Candidatus Eremiobacteraeota bacterium]|nr:type II secretion system F family protein [Candidatus Eremiobacteraeota bacterium]MCW5868774.1 type II secretion system F family protein [Candidatus Eremiobacteraeota bacterium]
MRTRDINQPDLIRVDSMLVVVFTRQLSSMLASGVPIVLALDTLSHQPEDEVFGDVIDDCSQRIQKGGSFSAASSRFPKIFPPMFQTMIHIGEQTGSLDESLNRLALWLERDQALRQRLRSALTYPTFVIILAALMALTIFYTIMPTFVSIFADMQAELPLTTKLMLGLTEALRSPPQVLCMLAVVVAGVTAFRRWKNSPRGALHFHRLVKRIPLIGPMVVYGGLARYCSAMEALLSSGMNLTQALRLAGNACGDPLLGDDSAAMLRSVSEGNLLAEHLGDREDIYPTTLRSMLAVGEETSSLPDMFGRTAAFYELEMTFKVEALGAALEPLMLAVVALVVATVILSIFLPLYSTLGKLA